MNADIGADLRRRSLAVELHAAGNFLSGIVNAAPAVDAHPLAGLEILVVLEEMLDLMQSLGVDVLVLEPVTVDRQHLVIGYRQHLGIGARLIGHLQQPQWPAAHHHSGYQRKWRDHQHVDRVTVLRHGARHVAVVAGVMHRRTHEAVDEYRAGFLVNFVFDRIGIHRDFDDDVEDIGRLFARCNQIQSHEYLRRMRWHPNRERIERTSELSYSAIRRYGRCDASHVIHFGTCAFTRHWNNLVFGEKHYAHSRSE